MATETITSTNTGIRTANQQASAELARIAQETDGAAKAGTGANVAGGAMRSLTVSAAGNMEAFIQAQSIMADGMRTAWQEWMGYSQSAMQRWTEKMKSPMQVRTPQDILLSQMDTAREEMDRLLQNSMRVNDVMTKAAGEAMRRITDRGAAATDEGAREGAEMQRPAA